MTDAETHIPFIKMHGLGNDFVVLDAESHSFEASPEAIRAIADRRLGVGCDQLITIEAAKDEDTAAFMGIYNADGGEVEACGNAARCIAHLLLSPDGGEKVSIGTLAGPITAWRTGELITVDMGAPELDWEDIPVTEACDTLHLPLTEGPLSDGVGVSVGNPHAVFFVDDAETVDLETVGPKVETAPLFPERTNVEAAQILDRSHIRMRVWERGVGITQACGTGACATLVAAVRRDLTDRAATVTLDGGDLDIAWREEDNHILMTGPVAVSFTGVLDAPNA